MKTYNFVYKTMFSDGRYYIGQHKTDNLDDNYYGSSKTVQDLLKNHPELQPKRIILKYCDTQPDLNYWEKHYISDNYKNDPLCLNGNNVCSIRDNIQVSEETKKKMSETRKGRHHSEETIEKIRKSRIEKHLSEETIEKIRKSRIGKHLSEETKRKLSESRKGKPTWNKGKHHTEETKRKLSKSLKGRQISEETKRKLSIANKGENHPLYGKHRVYHKDGTYHYEKY